MTVCDLCGKAKQCLQKDIDGREYDVCSECWNPLAERLKGKGRAKNALTVLLPPPRSIEEDDKPEPPDYLPKIWGVGPTLKQ